MTDSALSKTAHLSSCPWNKGIAMQMCQERLFCAVTRLRIDVCPRIKAQCHEGGFPGIVKGLNCLNISLLRRCVCLSVYMCMHIYVTHTQTYTKVTLKTVKQAK